MSRTSASDPRFLEDNEDPTGPSTFSAHELNRSGVGDWWMDSSTAPEITIQGVDGGERKHLSRDTDASSDR